MTERPSFASDNRLADWCASRVAPNDQQDAHKRLIWAHMRALADLTGRDHAAWFAGIVADTYAPKPIPTFDHAAHNRRVVELYGSLSGWKPGRPMLLDLRPL